MKRIKFLLLAMVLIFTLCACSEDNSNYKEAVITEEKGYNEKSAVTIPYEKVVFVTVSPANDNICKGKKSYDTLTEKQKNHYRYMKVMVEDFTEGFVSLGYYYTDFYKDISVAFHALMNDYPEYYWMPSSYYVSTVHEKGSIAFRRNHNDDKFVFTKKKVEQQEQEFIEVINEITGKALKETSIYNKAKTLHDELCKRANYATDSNDKEIYSAYGALLNGQAVCEGYARAFQLLCNYAGIENTLVSGTSKGVGHLWNMVKTEDGWYHIDCTWNDLAKDFTYTYFCLTDSQIITDHDIDKDFKNADATAISLGHSFNFTKPNSATIKNDYFTKNNLIFIHSDTEKMAQEVIKQYKNGNKTAHFSFENNNERERFTANHKELITKVQKAVNKNLSNKKVKIKTISFNSNTCILRFDY